MAKQTTTDDQPEPITIEGVEFTAANSYYRMYWDILANGQPTGHTLHRDRTGKFWGIARTDRKALHRANDSTGWDEAWPIALDRVWQQIRTAAEAIAAETVRVNKAEARQLFAVPGYPHGDHAIAGADRPVREDFGQAYGRSGAVRVVVLCGTFQDLHQRPVRPFAQVAKRCGGCAKVAKKRGYDVEQ